MSYLKKPFEELDVLDDFLMNQLAADHEVGEPFCRLLISTLLQREVGRVRVTAQKALPAINTRLRGIRLDVEVLEFADSPPGTEPAVLNIYDVEPHLQKELDLPQHNRFYQAKIDSRGLRSGEKDFSRLPNLYVLTILNWDPFGYDRMIYTIRNQCMEEPRMDYGDGLYFYYFYTNGKKGGNDSIRQMLKYISDSRKENVQDKATRVLHEYVERVKLQPEVRYCYMTLEDYLNYHIEQGVKAGIEAELETRLNEAVDEKVAAKLNAAVEAEIETRLNAAVEAEIKTRLNAELIQDILDLLKDSGEVPDAVTKRLQEGADSQTLRKWLKLAARAESADEFLKQIEPGA